MSDDGRAPPGKEPAGSPDAIFDEFVANAYSAKPAAPLSAPNGTEAKWAASVEQILDEEDNEVTEVGARPILRAGTDAPPRTIDDRDPPAGDTEVTRSAKVPTRRPDSDTDVTRAAAIQPRAEKVRPGQTSPVPLVTRAAAEVLAAKADAEAAQRVTRPDPDGTLRVVLLTNRKPATVPPPALASPADVELDERPTLESPEWKSLVRAPSHTTQRREALLVVPEVAKVEATPSPMREGSEDGMMPGGELDRKLGDMAVLLRYGHEAQVQREIDGLQAQYPRDLLMLRRIAEFWIATGRTDRARELLFSLATGLFERRNVEGMRQALEQVLVLDPGNERATRLIGLLDQRPTHER